MCPPSAALRCGAASSRLRSRRHRVAGCAVLCPRADRRCFPVSEQPRCCLHPDGSVPSFRSSFCDRCWSLARGPRCPPPRVRLSARDPPAAPGPAMLSAARVRCRFGDRVSPTSSSWSPLRPSVVDPPYLVLTPAACRSLAFDFSPPCRPSAQLGSSRPGSLACPPAVTPRVAFATLPAHVACRLLRRLGALLQVCLHLRPGAIGVVSAARSPVAFYRSGSRPRSGLEPRVFPVACSVLRGSLSSAPWCFCCRLSLVPVPVFVAGCSRPAELPRFVCCRRSRLRAFSTTASASQPWLLLLLLTAALSLFVFGVFPRPLVGISGRRVRPCVTSSPRLHSPTACTSCSSSSGGSFRPPRGCPRCPSAGAVFRCSASPFRRSSFLPAPVPLPGPGCFFPVVVSRFRPTVVVWWFLRGRDRRRLVSGLADPCDPALLPGPHRGQLEG